MTAPTLNADEYRVLTAYGRGEDLVAIAADTGLGRDWVAGALTRLVTLDRGRAREMAITHDRARAAAAAQAAPSGAMEDLLAAADRSGVSRLQAKATRIRVAIEDLRKAAAECEAERRALAEVAVARQALETATARLRKVRGAPPAKAAKPTKVRVGVDPRVVRAWAVEEGIEYGPIGRVPRAIVARYLAATGGAS